VHGWLRVVVIVVLVSGFCLSTSDPRGEAVEAAPVAVVQPLGNDQAERLSYADEFDGRSLDTAAWHTCYRYRDTNCTNQWNREQQVYTRSNVSVSDGSLHLTAERESAVGYLESGEKSTFSYTSGLVSTHDRLFFQYGFVEFRARVPKGQGVWPALWLLPESGTWPPEIDIMEYIGSQPDRVYMTNHSPGAPAQSTAYVGEDFSQGWHTFAVDWRPDHLRFFVDGVQRAEVTAGVPHEPMYVVANVAVGGTWPGAPDESTPFPAVMDVDYLRVWDAGWMSTPVATALEEPAPPESIGPAGDLPSSSEPAEAVPEQLPGQPQAPSAVTASPPASAGPSPSGDPGASAQDVPPSVGEAQKPGRSTERHSGADGVTGAPSADGVAGTTSTDGSTGVLSPYGVAGGPSTGAATGDQCSSKLATIPALPPRRALLLDDFSMGLYPHQWVVTGEPVTGSGTLHIPVSYMYSSVTSATMDMRDTASSVHVLQSPAGATSELFMSVGSDEQSRASLYMSGGRLFFSLIEDGQVVGLCYADHDVQRDKYWRIDHRGNVIRWLTSSNGWTWSERAARSSTIDLSSARLELRAGDWSGSRSVAWLDDVRVDMLTG
jgi:beta-glucanase (GH16 family)